MTTDEPTPMPMPIEEQEESRFDWGAFWRTLRERAEVERLERYTAMTPEERAAYDQRRREREEDDARPRATVAAVRTCAWTGETREVEVRLLVRPGSSRSEERWLHLEGGPTGWESMSVEYLDEAIAAGGWCACGGTERRWDKLFVPDSSLVRARVELGI